MFLFLKSIISDLPHIHWPFQSFQENWHGHKRFWRFIRFPSLSRGGDDAMNALVISLLICSVLFVLIFSGRIKTCYKRWCVWLHSWLSAVKKPCIHYWNILFPSLILTSEYVNHMCWIDLARWMMEWCLSSIPNGSPRNWSSDFLNFF